jgi:hypothetical protein
MEGTGGCRKLRFAGKGKGKRGDVLELSTIAPAMTCPFC